MLYHNMFVRGIPSIWSKGMWVIAASTSTRYTFPSRSSISLLEATYMGFIFYSDFEDNKVYY